MLKKRSFLVDPTRNCFSMTWYAVKNPVVGKLRMRKLNTKRAVALDAVPHDLTRDFGPGIAFLR